jgi:EAL domain-containing protein (putative c-di-GMP-specific phosphodiesterase class I)
VAVNFINTLKEYGCRFALDDFGTGDASFAYLKTLPIDFVKIDGSIVRDIVDSPKDLALVKSINEIGHFLGKKTVAEFVENDDILARLRQMGVDYAQGYGIEAPYVSS